ncbi:MAG: DUF4364 family protein [Candidatus Bathyarchaeia archaeon]
MEKRIRRDKFYIIMRILQSIEVGKHKISHIGYSSNLNYNCTQLYLKKLVSSGLVVEERKGRERHYHLTEKGRKILHKLAEIDELALRE